MIETAVLQAFPARKFHQEKIAGGINNAITGGGLSRIIFEDDSIPRTVVAKVVPSFSTEQRVLAEILSNVGHAGLVNILRRYPDNRLGEREIGGYNFLNQAKVDFMPHLYFGQIGQGDEASELLIEDLSNCQTLDRLDNKDLLTQVLEQVIEKLAAFHQQFSPKSTQLLQEPWVGKWWLSPTSDFLSTEVADYSLSACAEFIEDPEIMAILSSLVRVRPALWELYNSQSNTLIHWDMNPGNIMVSPKADFKVIDWQLAGWGVPQWDLAQLMTPFLGMFSVSEINEFINLYCQSRPSLDTNNFTSLYHLVVADHSFRSSITVILNGDPEGSEWKKCLDWVKVHKLSIGASLDQLGST